MINDEIEKIISVKKYYIGFYYKYSYYSRQKSG